ncbi:hypothetical protein PHLCEN_2v2375 [Hermanssonia centrifuga]|uniref:Uncharacterized protein n=1 Tax=Hermanssonia centrifuga TaxID=98765 RepID=A0A2R6RLY1_9APHY|nr:hypothetical protein PHLCEN_2v2375 [Hermanssonia centrifuga]
MAFWNVCTGDEGIYRDMISGAIMECIREMAMKNKVDININFHMQGRSCANCTSAFASKK